MIYGDIKGKWRDTVLVISKIYEHFRGEKGNCENRNPFRSITCTCSKEYLRKGEKVQIHNQILNVKMISEVI